MLVEVKNRSNSTAVYTIPELGDRRSIRREFAPGETKKINEEELEALTFIPGGTVLLTDYLQILDEKTTEDLLHSVEPEYNMSEADIKNLLVNGSLDAFLDCLDFAPSGVIDIVKKMAVELPLNDTRKREALRDKTGFDVDLVIKHNREVEEAEKEKGVNKTPEAKERRVQESGRRTTANYKVVEKKDDEV